MARTIKQAFADYKSNLEITDRQESLVGTRRGNVVKALAANLTLHPDQPSLVMGSWDRRTLTRYLREGDVDVMAVLHHGKHKDWDTPEGTIRALDRVKAILQAQDAYKSIPMRRDRNCITMQFAEFRLDVVPAFKHQNGYYNIPDAVRRRWVATNPFSFASKITAVNQNMNGTFVPIIKMVKGWNRHQGWPIRSFHLECMLHRHYQSYTQSYTYSSTLRRFFQGLPAYLRAPCTDPVMGDRVDTYLDNVALETRRQLAVRKAQAAARAANEAMAAEEAGKEEKAIRIWKGLLGEFFPAYG